MGNTVEEQAILDSLLDRTLDDLADLPEFKPFPAGAHRCRIAFESKVVNKHPSIEMKITAIETLELSDPTASEPIKADDTTGVLFMLDNEFGEGKLKEVMKVLATHFGTTGIRDTMIAANDAEVIMVTKIRVNKDTKVEYTDIVELTVV